MTSPDRGFDVRHSVFRAGGVAILLALGVFSGFLREVVLAYFFGVSRDLEIFRIAIALPSILSDGLAISFVSIMIAHLVAAQTGDPVKTSEAATLNRILRASALFVGSVFVLGIVTAPLQISLFAPGFGTEDRKQAIWAMQICWGLFALVGASLALRALLNVNDYFIPGALSPMARSFGIIAGVVAGHALLSEQALDYRVPVISAILGGALVLGVHFFGLTSRLRVLLREGLRAGAQPTETSTRALLGAVYMILIYQLLMSGPRMLDRSFGSTLEPGSMAAIEFSYSLVMVFGTLAAAAFNIVFAPVISRKIAGLDRRIDKLTWVIATITIVAAAIGVLLTSVAMPFVALVFGYGAFDAHATDLTSRVFEWQGLGLGPMVAALICVQILIAFKAHALLIGIAAVKLSLKFVLLRLLAESYGVAAAGMSYAVVEVAMALMTLFAVAFYVLKWRKIVY